MMCSYLQRHPLLMMLLLAGLLIHPLSSHGQSRLDAFPLLVENSQAPPPRDPSEPFLTVDLAILDSSHNADLPEEAFVVVPDLESADPEMRLVLKTALSYLGVPYVYGGTSREGVDCSGLVFLAYQGAGKKVPRTSKTLAKEGETVKWTELKPGDLLFFSPNLNKHINHVGIVIRTREDDVLFVHSTSSEGEVVKSWLRDPYWWKRFRKARRMGGW